MPDPCTLIDLSHTIEHGLVTYKGLPAPIICDYLSRQASRKLYARGTEFQIGKIEMVANTGKLVGLDIVETNPVLDERNRTAELAVQLAMSAFGSPVHAVFVTLDVQKIANLPAIKIPAQHKQAIDVSCLPRQEDLAGRAVLVETGWSRHWNTSQYFEGHPFLTEDAARFLADSGVVLVGIDSHNIDDVQDLRRPVHTILLRNEIPIVEHMTNLAALPHGHFRFFAVPVKVKGLGTFPVRAFAIV